MINKYIYLVFLGIFLLFFYVWQQNYQTQLGYRVAELKSQCDKWEVENESLRLKINKLISMDKLDSIAKEKKLFNPDAKAVIYLH